MAVDPVSLAIISACGWIGLLARNYYTEMVKIAVDRERREHENEQEELQRTRMQFDIIFQNLLTRVNEERDTIQALLAELRTAIQSSIEVDRLVAAELVEVRKTLASSGRWSGDERRNAEVKA